jgi:hypothetical protein
VGYKVWGVRGGRGGVASPVIEQVTERNQRAGSAGGGGHREGPAVYHAKRPQYVLLGVPAPVLTPVPVPLPALILLLILRRSTGEI